MKVKQEKINKYFDDSIEELKKHAEIANNEMSSIQIHIAKISIDIRWIMIIGGFILTALITIAAAIIGKL